MNSIKYVINEFLENETSIAFAAFLAASVFFATILAVGHLIRSMGGMAAITFSSAFVGVGIEIAILLNDQKHDKR